MDRTRWTRGAPWACAALFILFCLAVAAPGLAVKPGEVSLTAKAAAAYRALGSLDPDPKTRNPDYLARGFLAPEFYTYYMGFAWNWQNTRELMHPRRVKLLAWITARTNHIEGILRKEASAGVTQVVILGAGLDSRAYRYQKTHPQLRFYEVDLPATQAYKLERVKKLLGEIPAWVTYTPIDFDKETLLQALTRTGYDPKKKTLFIWEGVTYYISGQGVDSTLDFIAHHSAPGSTVVFDYMIKRVIDGDFTGFPHLKRSFERLAKAGEPYIFGIKEKGAGDYVQKRGLKALSDLGSPELVRRYLIRTDGTTLGESPAFLRIVHARVP